MEYYTIFNGAGKKVGSLSLDDKEFKAEWNYGGIFWYRLEKKKERFEVKVDIHLCDRCIHLEDCNQSFFGTFPVGECEEFEWEEES